MRKPIILSPGLIGLLLVLLLGGCGGGGAKTVTTQPGASTSEPSARAWRPGTPAPKITAALIAQAGHGLTEANTDRGTVDEVFGSVPANVHVNPSAKALDDQYARFGRCMAEHMRIHDIGHELALLVAYNRKDPLTQAAVEKESSICEGLAIAPDASYKTSLKTDP
jgi:hypothetical protein